MKWYIPIGFIGLFWGCIQGDPKCIEGRTIECACPGGGKGAQTCTANGTFTTCNCEAPRVQEQPAASDPAAELSRQRERELEALEKQRLALEAEIDRLNQEMEAAQEKLAAATSEEERQAAQQKLDELNGRAMRLRNEYRGPRDTDPAAGGRKIEISDACRKNPLDC
jgi:hypothetical protein